MLEAERGQPGDVLGPDVEGISPEAIERGVHVDRVPQDDEVHDETERAELVFLSFPIALSQFPALAVEDDPRQLVATFSSVELDEDAAAVALIVNEAQHIGVLVTVVQKVPLSKLLKYRVYPTCVDRNLLI